MRTPHHPRQWIGDILWFLRHIEEVDRHPELWHYPLNPECQCNLCQISEEARKVRHEEPERATAIRRVG